MKHSEVTPLARVFLEELGIFARLAELPGEQSGEWISRANRVAAAVESRFNEMGREGRLKELNSFYKTRAALDRAHGRVPVSYSTFTMDYKRDLVRVIAKQDPERIRSL